MTESNGNAEKDEESKAAKRARWEAFEFRIPCPGTVRVENVSYGDESDEHVHVVNVDENGRTTGCTCKFSQYNDEPGKHMVAVENRPAVLLAASDDREADETEIDIETDVTAIGSENNQPVAADGGTATIAPETDAETDTCENGCEFCPGPDAIHFEDGEPETDGDHFPCFDCFMQASQASDADILEAEQ